MPLPDFIIIGAMKSATSTLHDQLALQPGLFMSTPKEPNFFSNDEIWAKGMDWYEGLFASAAPGDIKGESSTHYTKLPTYPHTVARLKAHVPDARLIYLMRDPVDRLVSHYIHGWTERTIEGDINEAIHKYPELIAYGRYDMQLEPFIAAFGRAAILTLDHAEIVRDPQALLERVCTFIGYAGTPRWHSDLGPRNVSRERLRASPVRDVIMGNPVSTALRRSLVPKAVRNYVRGFWQMKERPRLTEESLRYLREQFGIREDVA